MTRALWSMFTHVGNQAVEEAVQQVIQQRTPEVLNLLNNCRKSHSNLTEKESHGSELDNDDDLIMDMVYEIQHTVGEKGRGKTFLYKRAQHPEDWIHGHNEVGDTAVRERLYCYLRTWMIGLTTTLEQEESKKK